LANDKTPLRDTAPATPQRAQKSTDRSTVARRRVIVGIGILVVLGVGLFLLFGGKDSPLADFNPLNSDPPVPTFAFTSTTSAFEATAINVDKKKQSAAAKQVTPQVRDAATELFQSGYIDPSGWGDTGAIEDLFTKDAQSQLEANIDTLTLGTDADAIVSTVQPSKSKLKVTALTDANAGVIRAMAQPWFHAIAVNKDGTFTDITVTGTLFLVQDGNDWKIESFSLNREMEPGEAPPTSASPSTSPSESA
jgi:hypothetical protein